MKKVMLNLVCLSFIFVLLNMGVAYGNDDAVMARITEIKEVKLEGDIQAYDIKLFVIEGEYKGKIGVTRYTPISHSELTKTYMQGDKVYIRITKDAGNVNITILDNVRFNHLISLGILLLILVIIFGGIKGILSILSLVVAGFLLLKVVIPLIIEGYSPVNITIGVAALIILISFILISGFTRKSLVAIIGTICGTVAAGLLAKLYIDLTVISGYAGEEATFLIRYMGVDINFSGLFLSGVIIGSIGVVMDVSMSITSFLFELKEQNSRISSTEMFMSGLKVGRDIMATMVNTLVLAYVGSSMPLLLIFHFMKMPTRQLLNMEIVSMEIIRALCGSIGLILTIPITAYIATMFSQGPKKVYSKYKV